MFWAWNFSLSSLQVQDSSQGWGEKMLKSPLGNYLFFLHGFRIIFLKIDSIERVVVWTGIAANVSYCQFVLLTSDPLSCIQDGTPAGLELPGWQSFMLFVTSFNDYDRSVQYVPLCLLFFMIYSLSQCDKREGIFQENKEKIITSKINSNLLEDMFIMRILRTGLFSQNQQKQRRRERLKGRGIYGGGERGEGGTKRGRQMSWITFYRDIQKL